MGKLRVGIVGVGNISKTYIRNLSELDTTAVIACSDIDDMRARQVADDNGIPHALQVDELLGSDEIDLVLNLTIPSAHHEVAKRALLQGKHVYNEKPLSVERNQGEELIRIAAERKVILGCAPDTFLGAGLQTCRRIIDSGAIGTPIGFNAFMLGRGPENWHPSPDFFYKRGGGPLFDMGPYYLTAIIALLGPIESISALARASFSQREITQGALAGKRIDVEIPTHHIAALQLKSGVIGQLQTSFDVWAAKVPFIEIYGSEGTISCPDPNTFDGPVLVRLANMMEWEERSLAYQPPVNGRGLGIHDISESLTQGRLPRASGALAFHVLDAMHSILESSETGSRVRLTSFVNQPSPMV